MSNGIKGISKRLYKVTVYSLATMSVAAVTYTAVLHNEVNEIKSQTVALANGSLSTTAKLSDKDAAAVEAMSLLAGAIPVTDQNGQPTSCGEGQVLSFTNGKIVCVSLSVEDDGGVTITPIGTPDTIDVVDGNNTDQQNNTGVQIQQGPKGDAGPKGEPGVISTNLGSGLSGTIANQILSLSIATDANGGLVNGANGLSLLASCANGQILKWDGSRWVCAGDNNVQVSEANLTSSTPGVTISGGTAAVMGTGTSITIATASATQSGLLNTVDWTTFNNKQNVLNFTGRGLFSQSGNTVSANASCVSGEVLKYNGTNWVCASDTDTNTTYTAGAGLSLSATTLKLDPGTLTSTTSLNGSDLLMLYDGTSTKTITYDALFGDLLGSLNYRGTWDASANSPNLSAACTPSTKGYYYVVDVAGTTTLDGVSSWVVNDWVVCNGTEWQRIQTQNGVSSVFGRTGPVTAANGDYTASQITNATAGSVTETTVQGAINGLEARKLSRTLADGLVFVGNSSNIATGVALSGDVTMTNTGAITIADSAVTSAKIADGTITLADLSANGCSDGQVMAYNGAVWICSTPREYTIGSIDSQAKTADGASIVDGILYLQTADATHPGLVSVDTQTLAGDKTFTGSTALVALSGTGAFDFSTSTDTFKTSSGANTFGGDTTIAADKNLSLAAGTGNVDFSGSTGTFDTPTGLTTIGGGLNIVGSTLLTSANVADVASGGAIGSAASTVDVKTSFLIEQTTAGKTLTLPAPSDGSAGRVATVSNTGTVNFTMYGVTLATGKSAIFVWNGTVWANTSAEVTAASCGDTSNNVCNGGNVLGTALSIGTKDSNELTLKTNNLERFTIASTASGVSTLTGTGETTITNTGDEALKIISGGLGDLFLDSGVNGDIYIGTNSTGSNYSRAITIGNILAGTTLNFRAGDSSSGSISFDNGRLYIDTVNNRVGVGTTAPSYTFDVNGSSRFTSALTASGGITLSGTSSNIALGSNWLSGDGADEGIYISSNGYAGVRTSSPAYELDVSGNARFTGSVIANTGLILYGSSSNIALGSNWLSGSGGDGGIYVDTSNRVGVGTSSLSYNFQVNGSGYFSGGVTSYGGIALTGTSSNIGLGSNWLSGTGGDNGIYVNSSGYVGIGTNAPATLLANANTYLRDFMGRGMSSSGLVWQVNSSSQYAVGIKNENTGANSGGLLIEVPVGADSLHRALVVNKGSQELFTFAADGVAYKPGGGSWNATSDARSKKDVQDLDVGLSDILALRPVSFKYNGAFGTANDGKTYTGVIAQEAQQTGLGRYGVTNTDGVLRWDSTAMTYAMVKAIQEQQTIINNTKSNVDAIKNGMLTTMTLNNLAVNGSLAVKGNATFGGKTSFTGQVTFNSETAGTATIVTGTSEVRITFRHPIDSIPIVNVTPVGISESKYGVKDVTKQGFTIIIDAAQPSDTQFNWTAIQTSE